MKVIALTCIVSIHITLKKLNCTFLSSKYKLSASYSRFAHTVVSFIVGAIVLTSIAYVR